MTDFLPLDMEYARLVTYAIVGVAIVLFAMERVALELVALGVIVALLLLGLLVPGSGLDPEPLLAGFANPALLTILALMVMGQGLYQTDALAGFTHRIETLWPTRNARTIALALLVAGIASAVINNTPVVIMFIPVLTAVALRRKFSARKIMMPLSFITILGGMTTLIGSSTNLLAAGVAEKAGVTGLNFLSFTVPGLAMAVVGGLYVIFVLPHLLPETVPDAGGATPSRNLQFISEVRLTEGHPLIGEVPVAGMFAQLTSITLRAVRRGGVSHVPPFEDITLEAGDVLIIAATRENLTTAFRQWRAFETSTAAGARSGGDPSAEFVICEALVPPGSRLVNNAVNPAGFTAQHGCEILGVERRSRMPRQSLAEIRLEAGDVLLLAGQSFNIDRMRGLQDLVVIEWTAAPVKSSRLAAHALVVFGAAVALIATGVLSPVLAAITGAFLMIAFGCLNIRQASRAIDRRIILLVGAAIAMATALDVTGGAMAVANAMVGALGNTEPAIVMSGLFLTVAIVTNIVSNNATAVLFTPIAISTAQSIGVDPLPFVVAVILGANASFASPIGYQTNLLVMGPGHYQFRHFLIGGLPLVLIVWVVFSLVAPWWYGV
ncbi:MAG: SLC13 family permease [Alphaproteobacteria bacterium]|nr:SLC13 family permease [Alphaproteobacteria bacterium]